MSAGDTDAARRVIASETFPGYVWVETCPGEHYALYIDDKFSGLSVTLCEGVPTERWGVLLWSSGHWKPSFDSVTGTFEECTQWCEHTVAIGVNP